MTEVVRTREIAAPPATVWEALADFGALAMWAPEVADHSCLTTEQVDGVGAARRIQSGRFVLIERVVTWEPGESLGYEIEGMPAVLGTVSNTWRVTPSGAGSTVSIRTTVDAGKLPPKRIIAKLGARRLADSSDKLLAALAAHVEDPS